jgi:hypothetical protein
MLGLTTDEVLIVLAVLAVLVGGVFVVYRRGIVGPPKLAAGSDKSAVP